MDYATLLQILDSTLRLATPLLLACLATLALAACRNDAQAPVAADAAKPAAAPSYAEQHAGDYATVPLKTDLSAFDDEGKRMLALLVQASEVMDDLYWQQSWPDKAGLLAKAPEAGVAQEARALLGSIPAASP